PPKRASEAKWDVLVHGREIPEPQHSVRQEFPGHERLLREPPTHVERREGAPLMTRAECGRPVPPDREAQEVFPVVVVVRLAEERKQSRIAARTAVVLGARVGERIFD